MSSEPDEKPPTDWRYVFVHGVLGWGVPFFALMLAWDYYDHGGWPPPVKIASLACISLFGGFVLGRWILKDRQSQ